ncbi:hypothetical protein, partial [Limosilactobacillus reuteri]|uniref:hypothetical protein n=1 Tax=Limosilactobacillus reuteri TaxID=1598 RepID=UPI001E2C99A6
GTKLIEKGKIRTIISGKSKIMVRILIFRGRNLIVNSQPQIARQSLLWESWLVCLVLELLLKVKKNFKMADCKI